MLDDRALDASQTREVTNLLRAAGLRVGGGLPCAPPGAGHVSAGAKVIVLAQAGAAEMELVHPTLDDRLTLAAAVARRLSSPCGLGTIAAHSPCPKTPRLEVEPARNQHHSRRQSRHADAQQGFVRVRSQCCRECAKSEKGDAAADNNQPSSGFRCHTHLSWSVRICARGLNIETRFQLRSGGKETPDDQSFPSQR